VVDPSGAVIVSATVTLSNEKAESQSAQTSDQGEYKFDKLAPGTYVLAASATGFKDYKEEGVIISAGQPLRKDIGLETAQAVTSTTVEGQIGGQVETEQSQIAGTITQKELTKIGLNGRNFTQLIALSPGVSNQTQQDEAKVGVQGSVKYSVNGGRLEYNTFRVDGNDVINAGINGSQSTLIVYPSIDALQDVQVLTSNYAAQYGKSASGTILANVKSGGDQFHGDLYYFNRNEKFNARNYFDQTHRAPLYRKNDVGFTVGGPLKIPGLVDRSGNRKLYFFVSEEWRIEQDPTGYTYNRAVPSLAERTGDFNDVCPNASNGIVVFSRFKYPDCPAHLASQNASDGTPGYSPFGNNLLPVTSVAQSLLNTNIFPVPNATSGCNSSIGSCFDFTDSPNTNWWETLIRIDYDLNSKNHLTARYIHDSWDTTVPIPQWAFLVNSFPTIQNDFKGPGNSAVVRLTQTLSTTLLNSLAFDFTTDHINLNNTPGYGGASNVRPAGLDSPGPGMPAPLGSIFQNGFGGKSPGLIIGGNNAEYGGSGFQVDTSYTPWLHSNPTYSIREDLTKVFSKHTFQFGAEFIIAQRNEINVPVGNNTADQQGILTFNNVNNLNGTLGNAFADFLTGNLRSFTQDSGQAKYYQRYKTASPYIQDDWKVMRRLTLNMGIRFSLFGNWHEKYGNSYNWVPSAFSPTLAATEHVDPRSGNLVDNATGIPIPINLSNLDPRITNGIVRCGTQGTPSSCIDSHVFNPEPRVGFAWDVFGRSKTSVRGGYGIFYEHGTGGEANTGGLEGNAPLALNMLQDYPSSYSLVGNNIQGTPGAFPTNVTSIPRNTPFSYVQQWSFGVQQELPGNFVSSLAYVGSKGTHLTAQLQLNQLPFVPESLNPFLKNQPITTQTCSAWPQSMPLAEGFDGTYFHENGILVGPGDPGYSNFVAVCQGSGLGLPVQNTLRTYAPGLANIFSLQNVANSSYNALQATIRKVSGPLVMGASYTYSHSIDNSSDRTDLIVNSADLRLNRASSDFDQRHLFALSYIYQLNLLKIGNTLFNWADKDPSNELTANKPAGSSSHWNEVLFAGWEISGITVFQSGTPFSVYNGGSPNGISVFDNAGSGNGLFAGSYVDIVGDPYSNIPKGGQNAKSFGPLLANPNAFAAPRGLTFGGAGRNTLNNPHRTNFDIALLKHFRLTESQSLELRIETFNTFNHTQFRIYDPDRGNVNNTANCFGGPSYTAGYVGGDTNCLTGSSFLHPVDAHRPRTLQLGIKYQF
jgi:hypothetical protein